MSRTFFLNIALAAAILSPVVPALAGAAQQDQSSTASPQTPPPPNAAEQQKEIQDLPPGSGRAEVARVCTGCHLLSVVTSQRKSESGWTDTVVEMRSRGANASDEDMVKIVEYLAKNFGPNSPPPAAGGASAPAQTKTAPAAPAAQASEQKLPPLKPQATPLKVVQEHFAALNACDWNRMMAQYADDMTFFSKNGAMVQGREAIGKMFKQALEPPSKGGQCGMKMTPVHIKIVGDTVNVVWRAEAPFFTKPYLGSEAFETRDGLLAAQVTTWDPSALPMKK